MISNLTVFFVILWAFTIFSGEKIAFWMPSYFTCSWPPIYATDNPGDYVKIAVITDPQLMDRTSLPLAPKSLILEIIQFYTDIYMRRAMLSSIMPFKPDMVLFLGDYFDGGPVLSDEEWQDSLNRFRHIFDLKTIEKATNNQVYFLSGNHDIGYSGYHSKIPKVISRYEKAFGSRNYNFTAGAVEFVVVDAQTIDGRPQQNQTSATWKFVNSVSTDYQSRPRVLLTHIPLYRPDSTPCGPRRSSPIIDQRISRASDDRDIVYQNYLTEKTTNMLLDSIKPVLVLSGHDHDQCTVTHIAEHGPVVEQTLGTISWQQGNLYPSFMLLTASKLAYSNASETVSTQLCSLPAQIFIYFWYIVLFVVTLAVVLLWPTNGLGIHLRIGELVSNTLAVFKSTKVKDDDENCDYEMVWDAEGSMHLIKKASKIAPSRSTERIERGNATMRSAAKKQIMQEINVTMPQDVSSQLGPDASAKLGPFKTNKSSVRLVIQRLLRVFQVLSVVAAVNVPIYIMLLFSDWIDK
nr:putative calcineurin-like metallo-phosphoesterase superfamily protein [Tanacetum cinerariifolium]